MFQFRLQRVLEIREKSEQEAAGRLAAARTEADTAMRAHEELQALHAKSVAKFATAHGPAATVGQRQNLSLVLEHLNRQVREAQSVAEAASVNVGRLLEEFTSAVRDRRALNRLRERREDEWRSEQSQTDRREMDDVAIARFVRRPTAAGRE